MFNSIPSVLFGVFWGILVAFSMTYARCFKSHAGESDAGDTEKKRPSGAKARFVEQRLMYGLKPVPSKTEAVCVKVRAKACALQNRSGVR
jgi:hypothetical protein